MPTITYDPLTRKFTCVIDEYGTTMESDSKTDLEDGLDALENWKRERDRDDNAAFVDDRLRGSLAGH